MKKILFSPTQNSQENKLNSKEILSHFQQYLTIKYRKQGLSWKKIYIDKLKYSDFHRTDKNGIKSGTNFFERMFQKPFSQLESEFFANTTLITLNNISKWNDIDFSRKDSS